MFRVGIGRLLILLAAACGAAWAQDVSGSISGVVADSSGALIPGATVSVTNIEKKAQVATMNTGSSGVYAATLLPVGTYTVSVEARGFKRAERTGIALNVNDRLSVNFSLEVGQATETISVQESAVEVQTQTAEQSNLISGTQVRELSLNNRNYEQLVTLMPGVSSGTSDQAYVGVSNPSGQSNTVAFSINGSRTSGNNWTIDGADNVDRGSNITLLNYPSVDAIAEFKVLRGNYSAEFGRSGAGQINVITKSGASQFHGDAYEFVRNNAFAANQFVNNANSVNLGSDGKARVPPLRYNNFGYTIGGPVYIPKVYNRDRNKTFFFFSQEFRRVITYSTPQAIVPTGAEKQGIFPNAVCIASTGNTCTQTATQIGNINPVAQAYLKDVFSKIPDGAAGTNQLYASQRNVYNARQELYRIDHVFTQNQRLAVRYLTDNIPTQEPGGLFGQTPVPLVGSTTTNAPGHSWNARLTSTFSPTWVNDGGYSYSYGAITSDPTGLLSPANSPDVKIPLPFASTLNRVPSLVFNSGSSITSYGPYRDYNRNNNVFDNMTKVLGRHTLKFGWSYNHYEKTENAGSGNQGTFTFSNTPKPAAASNFEQAFANFLLGNASNFGQASLDITPAIKAVQNEFYVNDDFRVNSRLTINAGVRYSLFGQPYDAKKMLTNFDPSAYNPANAPQIDAKGNIVPGTGNLLNGLIGNGVINKYGDKVSNESYKNFAPRFGVAYDPFGTGRTSIRAGYGMFYDLPLFGNYEINVFTNPPYVNSPNIPNTRLENPGVNPASVSTTPKTLRGTPQPYQSPYTQQWSLDIQHQLGGSMIVDVAYVGSKGTHLPGIVDINEVQPGLAVSSGLVPAGTVFTSANSPILNQIRPYRGFAAINSIENWFNSNYNSLQVQAEKRFSGSSSFNVSYTWSKNLTDNRSDRSSAPMNTYNRHAGEYGLAQYDRRHIFTANYVYDLPFFRDSKGFAGKTLGGWEISGITQAFSGLPLNPATSAGTDPAGLGIIGTSSAGPRPDWACNPNTNAPHSLYQWFNTSCFVDVPAGQTRPGNAGRSIIQGPGVVRFDVSLFKNVVFRESMRFQIRGEAFNVFNHVNPDGVQTSLGSSTYGRVTSYRDPRIIQLGAKFYF